MPNNQDVCDDCGHIYLLHLSNFKGECDACDDPTIPVDKKCKGFRLKVRLEDKKVTR